MLEDEYIEDRKEFVNSLKNMMKQKHISPEELSKRTDIPLDSLNKYLAGDEDPDIVITTKILKALGYTFKDLFKKED